VSHSSELAPAAARRDLLADLKRDKKSWLQHGIAALAVSVLGLGVAGSVLVTSAAQNTTETSEPGNIAQVASPAPQADGAAPSPVVPAVDRTGDRAKIQSLADQRAEELSKAETQVDQAAKSKAADARQKDLESASAATRDQAKILSQGQTATGGKGTQVVVPAPTEAPTPPPAAPVESDEKSCVPVAGGYRVAAHFGQVGAWSRYHTGFDFSAPVGTPLRAPAPGVVTNAGGGPASGWAGNYVAIQYPDGTQTLMAHMSTVSVQVGQTVTACQLVGAIGMTGRTFGPHVHFEVYPPGVTPGDVYKAVNPVSWMSAHRIAP